MTRAQIRAATDDDLARMKLDAQLVRHKHRGRVRMGAKVPEAAQADSIVALTTREMKRRARGRA